MIRAINRVASKENTVDADIICGIGYLTEEQKQALADILTRRNDKFVDFLNSYQVLTGDDLSIVNSVAVLLANANRKYSSNYNHMYSNNMLRTLQAITDLLSNMTDKDCDHLRFIIGAGFWVNNDFDTVESKLNPNY